MLFTDTMTVYNHYTTASTDKWNRTVIRGVQWRHNKVLTNVSQNLMSRDVVESITVDFKGAYVGNKTYVTPEAFKNLADKSDYWTLNTDGLDVIVYGASTTEITTSPKDLSGRVTVREVADNRNRTFLKNIKVVAK